MSTEPTRSLPLDKPAIARLIPHQGPMCLLDGVEDWSDAAITCVSWRHVDADHPLRLDGRLPACAAVEYAAQAMAVHGALKATASAQSAATLESSSPTEPQVGFLAAARNVVLHHPTLHDVAAPVRVVAELVAGDSRQAVYRFQLDDPQGQVIAQGRATVVLQASKP